MLPSVCFLQFRLKRALALLNRVVGGKRVVVTGPSVSVLSLNQGEGTAPQYWSGTIPPTKIWQHDLVKQREFAQVFCHDARFRPDALLQKVLTSRNVIDETQNQKADTSQLLIE